MASLQEAQVVEGSGGAAGDSTTAIMSSNFILNVLIGGPMDQIWSLMNNLQVVMFVRLFNIKSPGNVNSFTDFFDEITSIKLFDTQEFVNKLYYVPEYDSFAVNFMNAGYESPLFLVNASSFLVNFTLHFAFIPVLIILPILSRCIPKIRPKIAPL